MCPSFIHPLAQPFIQISTKVHKIGQKMTIHGVIVGNRKSEEEVERQDNGPIGFSQHLPHHFVHRTFCIEKRHGERWGKSHTTAWSVCLFTESPHSRGLVLEVMEKVEMSGQTTEFSIEETHVVPSISHNTPDGEPFRTRKMVMMQQNSSSRFISRKGDVPTSHRKL